MRIADARKQCYCLTMKTLVDMHRKQRLLLYMDDSDRCNSQKKSVVAAVGADRSNRNIHSPGLKHFLAAVG